MDRERRRADPAARTDDADEPAEFPADRASVGPLGQRRQRIRKQLRGQRLDDVFSGAGVYEVAIEADVVTVTDDDDSYTGFAKLDEVIHPRSRHLDSADVGDDRFGRAFNT